MAKIGATHSQSARVRAIRVWIIGFGTVGQWLARVLYLRGAEIEARYAVRFEVVALANRRDGFVYRERGIDLQLALAFAEAGRPLNELADVSHWPTALDGIRAAEADVLVEVSESPASDGEPGRSHLAEALGRGIPAVTSNKWAVAIDGVGLTALARDHATELRAESTVMSGTPVIGALSRGLAGATPLGIRGVLNATANFIVSAMSDGTTYAAALDEAKSRGLAERDPAADVDGYDSAAKLMIFAALVFGQPLRLEDVDRRGISSLTPETVEEARSSGLQLRELATLEPGASLEARVAPVALDPDELLARVGGTDNAVVCRAEPLGAIAIIGPGAGLELAGQGVLSDLINVAVTAELVRPR